MVSFLKKKRNSQNAKLFNFKVSLILNSSLIQTFSKRCVTDQWAPCPEWGRRLIYNWYILTKSWPCTRLSHSINFAKEPEKQGSCEEKSTIFIMSTPRFSSFSQIISTLTYTCTHTCTHTYAHTYTTILWWLHFIKCPVFDIVNFI